jgi:hypothetical protein
LGLPVDQANQCGIRKIVYDIEAAILLVDAEHPLKIQAKGLTKDDSIDTAVTDEGNVIASLLPENILKTVHDPYTPLPGRA